MNWTVIALPPLAFVVVLLVVWGLARLGARAAIKRTSPLGGATKAYACGEDVKDHMVQPDYSQFFPFAFFFTILHVVALMATCVPLGGASTSVFAVIYIAGAIVGLIVLYRR